MLYTVLSRSYRDNSRHKPEIKVCNFDLDMARLFEKARRCHEPTIKAYGHVLFQVSLDRIPTWHANLISDIIAAASCLNIRPSYRRASLYYDHQLRLPSHRSRYNPTCTRTPQRWFRCRCSGRDHFPGVKQGPDICRHGGMAKCSRLVSFLYIYFLKKIFSCLLLSRPLCWPPAWRHYRKDCMPVHDLSHPWASSSSFLVPMLVTLRLRLQIQWLRSGLRQDQELKFLHPWRSKEKRRKDRKSVV